MRIPWPMAFSAVLVACTHDKSTLCERFYEPYPDYIGNRAPTGGNKVLLDAMAAYDERDFARAAKGLRQVIDADASDLTARMYLVSALLGAGEPYKAEMHLDYLENARDQSFRDQVDWYNALCWLCTGENAKALQQAQWIVSRPRHTYHDAAAALVATLSEQ